MSDTTFTLILVILHPQIKIQHKALRMKGLLKQAEFLPKFCCFPNSLSLPRAQGQAGSEPAQLDHLA